MKLFSFGTVVLVFVGRTLQVQGRSSSSSQWGTTTPTAHSAFVTTKSIATVPPPRGGGVRLRPKRGATRKKDSSLKSSFLQRHPFASACAITTFNAAAADLLTQLVFERHNGNKYNPSRTLLFASFGFLFQGCAQYTVVNLVWDRVFPGASVWAVLFKMACMNFISDPLLFFPCFYIFKESMAKGQIAIKEALTRYSENYLQDWTNSWSVWFPGHAVTYGVMPSHKRIPWMAFLSFFYMCILSITRGGSSTTAAVEVEL